MLLIGDMIKITIMFSAKESPDPKLLMKYHQGSSSQGAQMVFKGSQLIIKGAQLIIKGAQLII
jgi:hypothetical protein